MVAGITNAFVAKNEPQIGGDSTLAVLSLLTDVLDVSSDFVCVVNCGKIAYVNDSGIALLAYNGKDELKGKSFDVLFPNRLRERSIAGVKSCLNAEVPCSCELVLQCGDGGECLAKVSAKKLPPLGDKAFVFSANVASGVCLRDDVTGLPSLPLFEDLLKMAIARATRAARGRAESAAQLLAIFSVGIDNDLEPDTVGYEIRNFLLNVVSSVLVNSFRQVDVVARNTRDGFLVLIENLNSIDDVEMIARRIMSLMSEGVRYKDQIFDLSCSIGISLFPKGALTVRDMIAQADAALDQARQNGGGGYMIYHVLSS